MDEELFQSFLKKGGRSPNAVRRCLASTAAFELHLREQRSGLNLDAASPSDLESYIAHVETVPKASARTDLWAIAYYYQFTSNNEMETAARALRGQRIKRTPPSLSKLRGVNPVHLDLLANAGIRNTAQMLKAGSKAAGRQTLTCQTGVPLAAIDELVQLSDLARIGGMKAIRTRLYFDAGMKTVSQLAASDPQELHDKLDAFVQESGFEGIAPHPKEVTYSVSVAKTLPVLVEF